MFKSQFSENKINLLSYKLGSITDKYAEKVSEQLATFQYSGPGNRLSAELREIRLPVLSRS